MRKHMAQTARRFFALMLVLALSLAYIPLTSQAVNGNWTYMDGYSWITGSFWAQDADLVYEDGQSYDWSVTICPGNKPPASAQVEAFIQDAQGNIISRYNKTVRGLSKRTESELCSYRDFPELTDSLEGRFTLTVKLISEGVCYATLVQTFQRTVVGPIVSAVTSRSKPDRVFSFADPLDLVLNVKKLDGEAESFLAAITITNSSDDDVMAARGIFLPNCVNTTLSIKDLLPIVLIRNAGLYWVNLTLTDTAGNILHQASTSFTVLPLADNAALSVGFGRVDISPTESVPLRGYGYSSGRMSTNIQDPLYATCIAIRDGSGNTVLLFTLDLINSFTEVMNAARARISEATGIAFDAIMVACTHTHSGPDLAHLNEPSIPRYIESLKEWMTQAAVAALADVAPARLYTASTQTENLTFVRRYLMSDGSYAGPNFGNFNNGYIVGHESEADSQLQLASFQREGKKDIVLANFQGHPHLAGGSSNTNVTADIIAPLRTKMESSLDCYFAYFTGASGNLNLKSQISKENIVSTYTEHGNALADYALDAYDALEEVPVDSVKITKTVFMGQVDHTYDKWGTLCVDLVDHYMKYGNYGNFDTSSLQRNGIQNIFKANAVGIRSQMPAYQEIPIYAISMGDLAFVTVPFEMFDTNGMQIKDGSPFGTTFVLSCSINSLSYLPSDLAFQHGGYAVDVTLFVRGTAEKLVTSYLGMLDTLYYNK